MDQDENGLRPQNEPVVQEQNNSAWSPTPFEGSPNTAFAISSPSGITFLPPQGAPHPPPRINGEAPTAAAEVQPPSSSPSSAEFCSFYERHELLTNLLLDQPPCPGGRLLSNPRACSNAQRGGHCLCRCLRSTCPACMPYMSACFYAQ